jgi:hypothetical protein
MPQTKLMTVTLALLDRIRPHEARGVKMDDLQIVLGFDTHASIKDDPLFKEEEQRFKQPVLLGIDYIIDADTPRLHSVRVKADRRTKA